MKLLTYFTEHGKLPVTIPPRTETQEKEVIIVNINILNTHNRVTLPATLTLEALKQYAIDAMKSYNLHTLEQEKQELLKELVTTADVPDDRKHHTIDQILKMPNHGTQTREELIKMNQKSLDNLYKDLVFA